MTLSVKDILLSNLDEVTEDKCFQPSQRLLDEIWRHIYLTTIEKGILMSNVIDGDSALDRHQVEFARTGDIGTAHLVRERLRYLFRNWAYRQAEEHEQLVMEHWRHLGQTDE